MHLSCCGINCESCDAFLATRNNDQTLRTETAVKWTNEYHHPFRPEDINCTGCHGRGVQIGHCGECGVRRCATARKVDNCGVCADYGCKMLEGFLAQVPPAKAQELRQNLEDARDALSPDLPTE